MARKYEYNILKQGRQVVGNIRASSYREADLIGSRQFGSDTWPQLILTDADEEYLRGISIDALKHGYTSVRDVAWPWFRLENGRDIDDTHYKNIVDSMPSDLRVAYYRENDEFDELSTYDIDDFVGLNPHQKIKKIPENKRTPEVYAELYGKFLIKAERTDFEGYQSAERGSGWDGYYDDVLYYIEENVPADKFSEPLNHRIRRYIMSIIKKKEFFNHSVFNYLPAEVFTGNVVFTKKLLKYYSSYIFDIPENAGTLELWMYALTLGIREGGFTGEAADFGSEEFVEYIPQQVRADPRIQRLISLYDEAEKKAEERAAATWQAAREKGMADHMTNVSKDGNALASIPNNWHTPEMFQAAVANNPKAIFHVPENARTKELWLQAVTADPSMMEYVRPVELQAELKRELEAGGDELDRIKNLAQPK